MNGGNVSIIKYSLSVLLGLILTATIGWTFISVRDFQRDYTTRNEVSKIVETQNTDFCKRLDRVEERMILRDKESLERILRIEDLLLDVIRMSKDTRKRTTGEIND